jgi:hypothetical protein
LQDSQFCRNNEIEEEIQKRILSENTTLNLTKKCFNICCFNFQKKKLSEEEEINCLQECVKMKIKSLKEIMK